MAEPTLTSAGSERGFALAYEVVLATHAAIENNIRGAGDKVFSSLFEHYQTREGCRDVAVEERR